MEMSAREARRKRILERGSDRLALISGRIQTLPSSSSSKSQDQHLSDRYNVVPHGEENTLGMALSKQEITDESAEIVEPTLHESETNHSTDKKPALDTSSEVLPSSSAPVVSNSFQSSIHSEPRRHVEPKLRYPGLFTANKISSSISASENFRVLCSVSLALLVVLSHLHIPLLGSNIIKGIIASRPLYLLLLTDITIVLAPLLLKQGGSQKPEEEESRKTPTEDGNFQAETVGKALEATLVLYKVLTAAFMDCSIYAVVVICGFSLAQFWL